MEKQKEIQVFINGEYVFTTQLYTSCKECEQTLHEKATNCELLTINNEAQVQYQLRPTDAIICRCKA